MSGRPPVRPVQPKNKHYEKVNWKISERVRIMVECVAEMTEREEYEVVDEFLNDNLADLDLLEWLEKQRFNKRRVEKVFPEGLDEAKKRLEAYLSDETEGTKEAPQGMGAEEGQGTGEATNGAHADAYGAGDFQPTIAEEVSAETTSGKSRKKIR